MKKKLCPPKIFLKQNRWQFISGLMACGGGLCCGNILGWSAFDYEHQKEHGQLEKFSVNIDSWIISIPLLAAFLFTIPSYILSEKIGPRNVLMLSGIPYFASWFLILYAKNFAMLLSGRFLMGITLGSFFVITPIYLKEIFEETNLKKICNLYIHHIFGGIFFCIFQGHMYEWERSTLFLSFVGLQILITLFFAPESPIYLFTNAKMQKAIDSLKKLRGADEVPQVVNEMKEIMKHIEEIELEDSLFTQIFSKFQSKLYLTLVTLSLILFNLNGFMLLLMIPSKLFRKSEDGKIKEIYPILLSLSILFFSLTWNIYKKLLVKPTAIKIIQIVSSFLTSIFLFLFATLHFLLDLRLLALEENVANWIILGVLIAVVISMSLGMAYSTWLFIHQFQVDSYQLKKFLVVLAYSLSWLFAFFTVKIYLGWIDKIGISMFFWIFSGFSLIGNILNYFILPKFARDVNENNDNGNTSSNATSMENL